MRKFIIIGAGPAGLAAAYELLKKGEKDITLLEAGDKIGGGARTVGFDGNYVDIGPHHFFTTSKYIKSIWNKFLPEQGALSRDDRLLDRQVELNEGGPDPDEQDRVMLKRVRVSRILYDNKFFGYPLSFSKDTLKKLGFKKAFYFGFGVLISRIIRRKERTMEDYLINSFGKALYNEFFRTYTIKAWGENPENISCECGIQRIKGISLRKALKQFIKSFLGIKPSENDDIKGSINEVKTLRYPKYGAGQMWELMADELRKGGVNIRLGVRVTGIRIENGRAAEITASGGESFAPDYVISSMPLVKLFECFRADTEKPHAAYGCAAELRYRHFIMVGIFASRLSMKNDTGFKTIGGSLPDCWSYIYNNVAKMSRFNVYNNFSPYVVKNWENEVYLGMEYLCDEQDALWRADDNEAVGFAVSEAESIGLLNAKDIIRTIKVAEPHAYPSYSGSYARFHEIREYIDSLENLYSIGRKGQHRYLDMDQSMLTAVECVKHIFGEIKDKKSIWEVTEELID